MRRLPFGKVMHLGHLVADADVLAISEWTLWSWSATWSVLTFIRRPSMLCGSWLTGVQIFSDLG
jgi:hypothetical protein